MAEYIERKKLEEAFDNADPDVCESDMDGHSDWGFGRENVRDVIRGVPAADVAPVVHGRWIEDHDYLKCPECGLPGVCGLLPSGKNTPGVCKYEERGNSDAQKDKRQTGAK